MKNKHQDFVSEKENENENEKEKIKNQLKFLQGGSEEIEENTFRKAA